MDDDELSFWQTKTFKIFISWFFVLLIPALLVALYFSVKSLNKKEEPKKVEKEIEDLRVGLSSDYTSPDISPTKNYNQSSSIFRNFYNSLVTYSDDGRIMPDLALSWTNPDDLTWRFILRKGVKFTDGKTLNAYDIKYTYDVIKGDSSSQLNDYFQEITEVNPLSPYEIEIKTAKPAPYLISKLSFLLIIPNGSNDISIKNTPGTGPFVYNKQETVQGEKIVMSRNDSYWGDKPKVKKVTAFVYPEDENIKVQDFKSGKLDIIDTHQKESANDMQNFPNTQNLAVSENSVNYLVLNNDDKAAEYINTTPNPLKDKRVRLAMWEALDTKGLVNETMKGIAMPADQIVTKQTFGFNPAIVRPEYNTSDAKKLMSESGNEPGFKVKLLINQNRKEVGEYIKQAWRAIGIDVEIESVPDEKYVDTLMSHDFGIGFVNWAEDSKDGQNTLMTLFGDSDKNMGSFKNANLNDIIQKLSAEPNQKNRQKLIQDGLEIVKDEIPVIPLYSLKVNWYIASNIEWTPPESLDVAFKNAKAIEKVEAQQNIFSKLKFW